MLPEIYWLDQIKTGRLAIMPRPRGEDWLSDEIIGLRQQGVDILVSLLEHSEIVELKLQAEQFLCEAQSIQFFHFPIQDRNVPTSITETLIFTHFLVRQLQRGKSIAIHCRAGIGRSALMVACVMVGMGDYGVKEVFQLISKARGLSVPDTEVQIEWLTTFYQKLV